MASAAPEHRNRSIRMAVLMSFLSKAGTALLQLIAMPVAARVLGREEFGLFATVGGLITTATLFEIGLGPALTHGLSRAVAEGDREAERRLYSTSFFLLAGLLVIAAIVLGTLITRLPVSTLFGEGYAAHAVTLRPALWLGLGLFLAAMMLSHTDRVREGYLEAGVNNAWGALGNLLAAAAVLGGIFIWRTMAWLLLAVYGSQLLARLFNTLHLLRGRPWLLPRPSLFESKQAHHFAVDGLAYAAFASVVNVVEFNLASLQLGHVSGPGAVAEWGLLWTLNTALLGFVLMITIPVWPAVVDAKARGDCDWIRRARRRLHLYVAGFALTAGAGVTLLGPLIFPRLLGPEWADMDTRLFGAYALYFLMHAWRHANHMLLVGIGRVKTLALCQVAESVIVLGTAGLGMKSGGLPGMLVAMAATIAAITGWLLPWLLHRELAGENGRTSPASS